MSPREKQPDPHTIKGRGAADNPRNRFEQVDTEFYEELLNDDERPSPSTLFIPDHSKSIIAFNDSPDIGFDATLNPYRGCEHGCAYCYARPTHEYLGYSAGIDFETRILVKYDAPELLRAALAAPKWKPQPVAISGVTDAYQPVERRLQLTRRCLEVMLEFRNPVIVITKNALVARDVDLFSEMAKYQAASINLSITSLDPDLARRLEPRASTPRARLDALSKLAAAGVPTGVMIAPVIPGLNDHEIPALLKAAAEAGATRAGYVLLRLPHGVKELFTDWLTRNEPGRKEKVLSRLRDMRGGKLYDSEFGKRARGEGPWADELKKLFEVSRKRAKLDGPRKPLSTENFRIPPPTEGQLELF